MGQIKKGHVCIPLKRRAWRDCRRAPQVALRATWLHHYGVLPICRNATRSAIWTRVELPTIWFEVLGSEMQFHVIQ